MSFHDFSSVAKKIYAEKVHRGTGYAKTQRSLIIALYKAYRRLNGELAEDLRIESEGDALNACDELYAWYADRYVSKGRKTQNRGISKNISFKNTYNSPLSNVTVYRTEGEDRVKDTKSLYGSYFFDEPYEKRQFEKYLVKPEVPKRNEDFLAFILHVAVAFLLKPPELDALLKEYGFQQLHVRNIHHLAIYATLSKYWPDNRAETINDEPVKDPFVQVRSLYEKARDILNGATSEMNQPTNMNRLFGEDSTKWIRDRLMNKKELSSENLLEFIEANISSFTMRHKTILDDHHKFASLYRYIFDKPICSDCGAAQESDFSFYEFTNSFCCPHEEKKFREKIFDQIDKYGKHPTRELMICFWLYTVCFTCVDSIYIDDNVFRRIIRKLTQYNVSWAEDAKQCYSHSSLNIIKFVDEKTIRRKTWFRGADIVDFIETKLRVDYEWGMLDSRNTFDYYIEQLKYLDFEIDLNGKPYNIRFKGEDVHFTSSYPDAVPCAIVVLFEVFKQLKFYEEYPLECNIYEQI